MLWLLAVRRGVKYLLSHFCIILFCRLLGLANKVLALLLHEEAVLAVVQVNELERPAGLSHFFYYFIDNIVATQPALIRQLLLHEMPLSLAHGCVNKHLTHLTVFLSLSLLIRPLEVVI